MHGRFRKIVAVPLIAGATLAYAGIFGGATSSASPTAAKHVRQIVIGFPADLSGGLAVYGTEQLRAAQLAVKQINASNHAVHVTLDSVDTQSLPTAAVSGTQSLLGTAGLNGIVGFDLSGQGIAAMPLIGQKGVPAIFLQVTDIEHTRPKNVFTMAPPVGAYIPLDITEGLKGLHPKSLAMIYQDNPTLDEDLTTLAGLATKKGISVVSEQGSQLTDTDFSSQISAVLATNPSVVGVLALAPASGTIVQGLRSAGFKGPILAQQGIANAAFRQVAGADANGVVFASTWDPAAATPLGKRVEAAYASAYPSDPPIDTFGVEAYDGINIMVDAVIKGGTSNAKVVEAIATGKFTGTVLQPSISFTKTGYANLSGVAVRITPTGTTLLK